MEKLEAMRHIFGQRRETINGIVWTFRMTRYGVTVRKLHSRKVKVVGFDTLANAGRDQMMLFPGIAREDR